MSKPIYVTRPSLPPLERFLPSLQKIWDTRVLTNDGPAHRELEQRLAGYFQSPHVSLCCNGMLALSVALEAAGLTGEVITTPFSFVATTHAIAAHGLDPVFVDVRPDDLNIDPERIEAAITDRTSAIVAVHVYGNPCAVDRIEEIARRYKLKVIYDAAHAFGVEYRQRSLLSFGDFSALSFHATKAFNTFEGGAIVSHTEADWARVKSLRNFGIADEVTIPSIGTNAKMSEFNAALGLVQLEYFEDVRSRRQEIDTYYRNAFAGIPGLRPIALPPDVLSNYSYFPIRVAEPFPLSRDALYERLKATDIFTRRYFYPLLSTLPMYRHLPSAAPEVLSVATEAASQILCLPIYPDLAEEDCARIVSAILAAGRA